MKVLAMVIIVVVRCLRHIKEMQNGASHGRLLGCDKNLKADNERNRRDLCLDSGKFLSFQCSISLWVVAFTLSLYTFQHNH